MQKLLMKIYTIKDIARLAGVSVTTVSRVLNHRPDVNHETREKVERIIAECHFVGNANARGLKQTEVEMVAMILRGRRNPFLNELAEAILQAASDNQLALCTEFIDESADEFRTAWQMYCEKRACGFIFVGSLVDKRAHVLDHVDVPMVFVTVDTQNTLMDRASSVSINDRQMGHDVMKALLDRGHTRIAMFGGDRDSGDCFSKRYQGALDACRESGVAFDPERYVQTRFSLAHAGDETRAFFQRKPDTTAVFCMGDTVAMGVIRALRDMGKRVPEDVSVFGYDGTELSSHLIPRLSTVQQPIAEIADRSVAVLAELLSGASQTQHIVVPASIELRESVTEAQRTLCTPHGSAV